MTYKTGPFFTTTLTLQHPMFVKKNKSSNPTILVGLMTSERKEFDDYEYMARQIKTMGIKNLIYGTDGEPALEAGFESIFPVESENNIHLWCFEHVKEDMRRALSH